MKIAKKKGCIYKNSRKIQKNDKYKQTKDIYIFCKRWYNTGIYKK